MSEKKTQENELDINFDVDTLVILGRIDCPKLTHCRVLISNILNKISEKNMKTHFVICFETQFEFLRNYLLKQNLSFIDYPDSPIIYIQEISGNKKIIGSLNEFQKYIIKEFNYHDTLKTEDFVEETNKSLKNFLDTNGNKYVYFDFNIDGEDNSVKNRIVLELYHKDLPLTSDNFYKLCVGCKNDEGTSLSYKGSFIHRISKNSFIQGGDIRIDGPKSIYGNNFNDENYNIKHDSYGILGMVKKANIGMHNIYNVAFALLGIISALSVNFIPSGIFQKNFIMLFLCGIIIAVALILPGISTSHIMLVFGIYETALQAVSQMDILYISVLGTGILAGTFLFTKTLGKLMQKFPSQTFMAITGFVMTSVYDIFPGLPPYPQFMPCILLSVGAFILICSFTNYK